MANLSFFGALRVACIRGVRAVSLPNIWRYCCDCTMTKLAILPCVNCMTNIQRDFATLLVKGDKSRDSVMEIGADHASVMQLTQRQMKMMLRCGNATARMFAIACIVDGLRSLMSGTILPLPARPIRAAAGC